ncbi:uncharacterized protein MYCFIDRAFT_85617 [Pseudocercospora fijiensis CIRAD86]|uniref:J domain-containing protein n=1 Tax=Pseudocercospora fijiensis (strain CIRAD86) TaxID=383855 RepID=N1Q5N0_PSEFD|nr:uncharacterized protein MYCFIDRAFT_85617 [Pseudocercospora fijiensis CIRAD86]EME87270.1 hypothetical protein MYCFIDRAFT_85617 [Pseudocercospora fijiensis CIRAD86]
MGSPLPPDPYEALGVPKDATSAAVKTAHRKLVLKCHPDKVTDPAEKQAAADRFHKIQSAYEILIDESRRERYDAQVRLAELKKEAMARSQGAGRSRGAEKSGPSPPYRTAPSEAPRGAYASRGPEPARPTPQYEERRPPYAADYFDPQPRATQRKEPEPERERTSRRTAHEVKERFKSAAQKAKSVKEHEKERRREKTRQSDRDTRQERERKHTPFVVDVDSDSESDEQEMRSRRMPEEDEERRARETYYAQMFKQRREAEEGHYGDERARKLFTQTNDVRDYIASSRGAPRRPEPSDRERERERERERRPSPVRMGSSKDGVEYVKRKDGRPAVMVRRASSKPGKESSSKEKESSKKASSRTPERRSSEERVVEKRKPPPLATSKSSPADIHIPEKPRSASVQINSEAPPVRPMQRSETMPTRKSENTVPTKSSNFRSTELNGGMPTPAPTPEESAVPTHKFPYGKQYADDNEFATPDGYRTETRELEKPPRPQRPQYTRKTTRSPSPTKEAREPLRDMRESRDSRGYKDSREMPRDRDVRDPRLTTHRSTSARNFATTQPSPPNVRTTSYKFNGSGVDPYDNSRPSSGRDTSPREREPSYKYDQRLYGEIPRERDSRPASGSPRQAHGPHAPPVDEGINYRRYRPEDIKYQTGYSIKRPSVDIRPSLSRNGSGHASYYQQQPVRA